MILRKESLNFMFKPIQELPILLMELGEKGQIMELLSWSLEELMGAFEFGILDKKLQLFHLNLVRKKKSNLIVGQLDLGMHIMEKNDA